MLIEHAMCRPSAARPNAVDDRRINERHDGAGLLVHIEGRVYPVVNISTGGLCLAGLSRKVGDRFRFVLSRLGEAGGVAGEAEVLGVNGGLYHLVFTRPTMPLLRLVVGHVSALIGVAPHLLKNR